jgi:hypothetical protein
MSEGFFERWSRRKVETREGREVEAEAEPEPKPGFQVLVPPPQPSPSGGGGQDTLTPMGQGAPSVEPERPLPTLEDVKALTGESDFSRFVAPQVAPEVKNAALKKLFSDPRYNVMDGLDVYVDDYSQPDPIPEALLRKLAAAQLPRLFEEKEPDGAREPRDVADAVGIPSVAQSAEVPEAVPEPSVHDDPDLRLQQDDAAQGPEPGRNIE